jgi:4-hydroxy-3-methylbut-2-en-1-yl diphosphate reductase
MKVLLPKPRGFCAGVELAIQCLESALQIYGAPLYVYHQIVHNKLVVQRYERRGVVFVSDLGEVPRGATIIYSAHGVAPDVRHEAIRKQLNVIDATCPLVTKVHAEARYFTDREYATFFIGHPDHDESVGILGEAPTKIQLLRSEQEVAGLSVGDSEHIAYLTQTTLAVEDTQVVIDALRRRFPNIVGPHRADICYATQNRQEAVRTLAAEADLALVIGSDNSSNSQRLVEVALAQGIPAYLIDEPEDIDLRWIDDVEVLLLTAGASVPEDLVLATMKWLEGYFDIEAEERTVKEESVRFQMPANLRFLEKTPNEY